MISYGFVPFLAVGDSVGEDDVVAEIETDKVSNSLLECLSLSSVRFK